MNVPEGTLEGLEVAKVSDVVHQLVVACSRNTLNGKGPTIAEGAIKLTASRADLPQQVARLTVPDFDLRAVAFVLEIPAEMPARDMATQAIKAEIDRLAPLWDEARDGDGHSGSPGEGIIERLDELDAEIKRRAALNGGKL